MSNFLITVGVIFAIAYMMPTIVALCRGTHGLFWIFFINLFFGWSLLGWAMSCIWAVGPTKAELLAEAERQRLQEEANRAIVKWSGRADLHYKPKLIP